MLVALINYRHSPQQILDISTSPNIRTYELKKYVLKEV